MEIKYKYVSCGKTYIKILDISIFTGKVDSTRNDNYPRGKDVYEGDIIKFNNAIGLVYWSKTRLGFSVKYFVDGDELSIPLSEILECEKIGDIKKNLELLEVINEDN